MKYSIVFSSVTGNTKKLAETIKNKVGECYFGKPCDEALEADIKAFIEKLSGKKVFIFGTAGYDNTKEYFSGILDSVKKLVPQSNTIIGTYMCQGRVSDAIQNKIKEAMPEKFEAIKDNLVESLNHPNENDIKLLISEIDKINL